MNVKITAIKVLQQSGTALHAKDIAKRMVESGLWPTKGKTPDATVAARLYSDIKEKGDQSDFVRTGPRIFALRSFSDI